MNDLAALPALAFSLPSPAYLLGAIVFGLIGFGAFRYGRKAGRPVPLWLGVALMLYPYAVSQTVLLYAVGTVLCVGLFLGSR